MAGAMAATVARIAAREELPLGWGRPRVARPQLGCMLPTHMRGGAMAADLVGAEPPTAGGQPPPLLRLRWGRRRAPRVATRVPQGLACLRVRWRAAHNLGQVAGTSHTDGIILLLLASSWLAKHRSATSAAAVLGNGKNSLHLACCRPSLIALWHLTAGFEYRLRRCLWPLERAQASPSPLLSLEQGEPTQGQQLAEKARSLQEEASHCIFHCATSLMQKCEAHVPPLRCLGGIASS
jgi:hypothetical protein